MGDADERRYHKQRMLSRRHDTHHLYAYHTSNTKEPTSTLSSMSSSNKAKDTLKKKKVVALRHTISLAGSNHRSLRVSKPATRISEEIINKDKRVT